MPQIDEPFNDTVASSDISSELDFRLATEKDISSIVELMQQRNPEADASRISEMVTKEVTIYNDGINYGVFVACLQYAVIGFCRYYNSDSVPEDKIKFKSNKGFYGAGIIVHKNYRRKGVARFLSKNREEWLLKIGAIGIYSCVDITNKSSQRMHVTFGYKFVGEVDGAFTQSFAPGKGLLYYKNISKH